VVLLGTLALHDLVVYLVERWTLSMFGSKMLETLLVERRFTCFLSLKPGRVIFCHIFLVQ